MDFFPSIHVLYSFDVVHHHMKIDESAKAKKKANRHDGVNCFPLVYSMNKSFH